MNETIPATCCNDFLAATLRGTDNEAYGALMHWSHDKWTVGCELPPPRFCPWCGKCLPAPALEGETSAPELNPETVASVHPVDWWLKFFSNGDLALATVCRDLEAALVTAREETAVAREESRMFRHDRDMAQRRTYRLLGVDCDRIDYLMGDIYRVQAAFDFKAFCMRPEEYMEILYHDLVLQLKDLITKNATNLPS